MHKCTELDYAERRDCMKWGYVWGKLFFFRGLLMSDICGFVSEHISVQELMAQTNHY